MTRSIIHVDGRVERFLANADARSTSLTVFRYPDSVVLQNGERFESIAYVSLLAFRETIDAMRRVVDVHDKDARKANSERCGCYACFELRSAIDKAEEIH